jgi:queuine tRNA-ribosyltransferase
MEYPSVTTPEGPKPSFVVTHSGGKARPRVGRMTTAHGTLETPCFLPIATNGSLRAMSFEEAAACGTRIVMVNAWHVHREVGPVRLRELGGVHGLMGWSGAVFTDSGGYQVFSLRETSGISDEGVSFGPDEGVLTPEEAVRIQKVVGSDIMIVLDDCAPFPCKKKEAQEAVRRTTLWAQHSVAAHEQHPACYAYPQQLWGIIQGSVYPDLRERSVAEVAALGFDGYGIGGLSIGMPKAAIQEMTSLVCEILPHERPRHLLGVGLPPDVLEGVERGVDSFDCVLPIRKGQRGTAYTSRGEVTYKQKQEGQLADAPLDPKCACPTCRGYTRERLRQLYREDKAEAGRLASIHNIFFYHNMMAQAREAIKSRKFPAFKKDFLAEWEGG